ncbi:hypothetical protein [Actinomadura nitritigenes]|uniref:hypothetical protein n=1 Tax=Actinomadura nitritigenes TaxID=134602 RepID=UPI003D907E45
MNAELERGRAIAGAQPADREPYVQFHDTRGFEERRETGLAGTSRGWHGATRS